MKNIVKEQSIMSGMGGIRSPMLFKSTGAPFCSAAIILTLLAQCLVLVPLTVTMPTAMAQTSPLNAAIPICSRTPFVRDEIVRRLRTVSRDNSIECRDVSLPVAGSRLGGLLTLIQEPHEPPAPAGQLPNGALRQGDFSGLDLSKVSAINAGGISEPSAIATITALMLTPPAEVRSLSLSSRGIEGRLTLSWQAPVDDGGSNITGYRIERADGAAGTFSELVADTGDRATRYDERSGMNGFDPANSYRYRVSALNSVGPGPASDVVTSLPGRSGICERSPFVRAWILEEISRRHGRTRTCSEVTADDLRGDGSLTFYDVRQNSKPNLYFDRLLETLEPPSGLHFRPSDLGHLGYRSISGGPNSCCRSDELFEHDKSIILMLGTLCYDVSCYLSHDGTNNESSRRSMK